MVRTLFTLAGMLMMVTMASAQSVPSTEPAVVVTGQGVVKAAPDRAFVTLIVESRAKAPKDAQSQNATVMTNVQKRLMALALPKDAVRTLSFDLNIDAEWVNGRQVPRGYVARNTIEVRFDDVARVGEVIDAAIASGANSVQNVRFDLKERESLEREALKRATADARARAEAAAAGAGGSLGRVLRIEEPTGGRYEPPMPMMMRAEAADARATTPIVAGEIEIRATVVLTAALK